MNVHQLRQSLQRHWLTYYGENQSWLISLQIWGTYDGQRRPFSGYILGVLSVLEPFLAEWLPLIVDLNSNPDDIIKALGLNFNPEEQLYLLQSPQAIATDMEVKMEMDIKDKPYDLDKNIEAEQKISEFGSLSDNCQVQKTSSSSGKSQMGMQKEVNGFKYPPNKLSNLEISTRSNKIHAQKQSSGFWSLIANQQDRQATTQVPGIAMQRELIVVSESKDYDKSESLSYINRGKPAKQVTFPQRHTGSREIASKTKEPVFLFPISPQDSQKHSQVPVFGIENSRNQMIQMLEKKIGSQIPLMPCTNAKTLNSWLDEFCEGK